MEMPKNRRRGPTGPRTPLGKKRAAKNATKHGILAVDAATEKAWEEYVQSIADELRVTGPAGQAVRVAALPPEPVMKNILRYQTANGREQLRLLKIIAAIKDVKMAP